MKLGLTKCQRRLLDFIKRYSQEMGCAPSYQQMAQELGLQSKSGIHRLVHGLAERGHIRLPPSRRARALVAVSDAGTYQVSLSAEMDDRFRLVCATAGKTPEGVLHTLLLRFLYPDLTQTIEPYDSLSGAFASAATVAQCAELQD